MTLKKIENKNDNINNSEALKLDRKAIEQQDM